MMIFSLVGLFACAEKEDGESGGDTGAPADDGGSDNGSDVMSENPSCDQPGLICYSFEDAVWQQVDSQGFCGQISAEGEAEGAPAMTYGNGCPSDALSACTGAIVAQAVDEDGEPVADLPATIYYYVDAPEVAQQCDAYGGTLATL